MELKKLLMKRAKAIVFPRADLITLWVSNVLYSIEPVGITVYN